MLPLGSIQLMLTLGDPSCQATTAVKFLIVDASSAYNMLLGRPSLNAIKAIPSAYHMMIKFSTTRRGGNRVGWARLGRANSGPGQNRARPKLARFFRAKILTAQLALKTGPVGPNCLFKAKTNLGEPGQIWPFFFRANNLMAQPGPNFGRTGLAHRVGPILPPLTTNGVGMVRGDQRVAKECYSASMKQKVVDNIYVDELDMRDEVNTRPKPSEELEFVQLDDNPEHLAYIDSKLAEYLNSLITHFLK